MKTLILAAALLAVVPAGAGHGEPGGQVDAHPAFTVGTATAQRGQRAYGVIKVPAGSDAGYDIPVAVLHGFDSSLDFRLRIAVTRLTRP